MAKKEKLLALKRAKEFSNGLSDLQQVSVQMNQTKLKLEAAKAKLEFFLEDGVEDIAEMIECMQSYGSTLSNLAKDWRQYDPYADSDDDEDSTEEEKS